MRDDSLDDVQHDPFRHLSATFLRDLVDLKAATEDPKMAPALLADLKEYDELLSRIQLALSTLEPPKFKVIHGKA